MPRRLLLALFSLLLAGNAWGLQIIGRVVGVTDGDTITVIDDQRTQHKIRLAGIDAPEKAQAFGQRSKEYLSSLVFGRQVVVHTEKQDRYKRTVGKVIVDGRDANLAMVVAGMAWHYKKYQSEQSVKDRETYSAAEQRARLDALGLWAATEPIEPSVWRSDRQRRLHRAAEHSATTP